MALYYPASRITMLFLTSRFSQVVSFISYNPQNLKRRKCFRNDLIGLIYHTYLFHSCHLTQGNHLHPFRFMALYYPASRITMLFLTSRFSQVVSFISYNPQNLKRRKCFRNDLIGLIYHTYLFHSCHLTQGNHLHPESKKKKMF